MRHTDTLLKHEPKSVAAQREEDAKARRHRLDSMAAEAQELQALQNHPGWATFMTALNDDEKIILGILERCGDPTTLAKVSGSLLVIKSFQTWPQDRAAELLGAIEDAKQDDHE